MLGKEDKDQELVEVKGFQIPKDEADHFVDNVEITAKAAEEMMREYCPKVIRTVEDPREGEAIIGYFKNGEEAFKVLLDPFEVPIMEMAMKRGRLKAYILAKNGLTEEDAEYLSKQ